MWFVGNGIKGDPGKFMANLLNERKRKKCVCLCFNAAFNNFFSLIMTVYGCSRELLYAHFKKTGKHLMTGKRRKTPENTKILQENTKEKFLYSVMV